jgi:ankyrin repeat protein
VRTRVIGIDGSAGLPLKIAPISSLQQDGALANNTIFTVISAMTDLDINSSSVSVSCFASLLKTTMPELYLGETAERAKIILRGWSKQALEEQIMIFLFHLSNKALTNGLKWELIFKMIECSGVMSTAMVINDTSSTTLLAIREMLFQLSFKAILEPQIYGIVEMDASMPRILKLIRWLLESGQAADTAIDLYDMRITPLQIAAFTCSKDLLAALLENRATPDLVLQKPISVDGGLRYYHLPRGIYRTRWAMPPVFLAAYSARRPEDLSALDLLSLSGATINCHLSTEEGFLFRDTFLSLVAGKKHEDIALDIMERIVARFTDDPLLERVKSFDAADIAISAASRGNLKILNFLRDNDFDMIEANKFGLTALHAAAYEGHVECCKLLLAYEFGVDQHDLAFPSPVHLACYRNHVEVVKLLHQQGACIDRELRIPPGLRKLVMKRYFCDHLYVSPSRCRIGTPDLLTQLQSPIGAALCVGYKLEFEEDVHPPFAPYTDGSLAPLVSYLLHHGITIPSSVLYCAASRADTELLSIALEVGVDPDSTGPNADTLLLRVPSSQDIFSADPEDQSEWKRQVQIEKMLLNARTKITKSDAVRAIRLGDWDLVKEMLRHPLLDVSESFDDPDDNISLLEEALRTGNSWIVQEVLKRDSICYSPGALCAAILQAVTGAIDPDIIYHLLKYRNPDSTSQECLMQETTAVGIAACYGSSRILELLLVHLPVFNTAYIPPATFDSLNFQWNRVLSMKEAIEKAGCTCRVPFWHRGFQSSSVLIYTLESNTDILPRLLDCGYRFDWITVARMTYFKNEERYLKIASGQPALSHDTAGPNLALGIAIRSGDTARTLSLLQVCKPFEDAKLRLGYRGGPLQVAIEIGSSEMFDILLEAGVNPSAPAEENGGMTALQAAAIYNRIGLAKCLIDLKVDLNAPGATLRGRTALEGAAEHGHIDMITFLLHSGVETTGSGQRQYLRAIGFALRNGHQVAADMLKRHRKITEEEESIMKEKYPLRQTLTFDSDSNISSSCGGSPSYSRGRSEDKDADADEEKLVYGKPKTVKDDLTAVDAEETALDEEGNYGIFPTSGDHTLLFYDDEITMDSFDCLSDDIRFRHEPRPVSDVTAPSEGIYNLDYPLFDLHDMGGYVEEDAISNWR